LETRVLRVDRLSPDQAAIAEASDVIRRGGLVAFPTETVYGLGADALNPLAVERVYRAKGRPPDNPLIVHIAGIDQLYLLARELDWRAEALAECFWPGPLTLVVKRAPLIPPITVGGLGTVAVRMPRHVVALRLIEAAGCPIAAPSANKSGRPSPTDAQHVLEDLAGEVEVILDAGPTDIGLESTVLDISSERPVILRPGGVSREEIESVIGGVEVHPAALGHLIHGEYVARSPGMKYRHYAPRAKVVVIEGEITVAREAIQLLVDLLRARRMRVGVLGSDGHEYAADLVVDLGLRSDAREAARRLFRSLREMDRAGVEVVVAEDWADVPGMGLAVSNRLRKAAGGIVLRAERLLSELKSSPGAVITDIMGT